jgi:hypothetical protein
VRLFLATTLLALLPSAAFAEVSLQLQNGRVTLVARRAAIQQVLGEWARKGRTRIVNLERVAGPPLTLELKDVPEQKALAILLRSVAGYIAAPRPVAMAGASVYDRILILPTSRPATTAVPAARPRVAVAPPIMPDPTELANGEGEDPNAADEQQQQQPGDLQQRQPPVFMPNGQPPTQEQEDSDGQTEAPANPGVLTAPGITPGTAPGQFTSPTPGVLPPPPPPATPQPRQ